MGSSRLDDLKLHVKTKLSALWAAVMFCYIYGDYFGLYVPGQLKGMLAGQGPVGPTSQGSLLATSLMMAVPGLMVFLTLVAPAVLSRWLNILLGTLFTLIMLATMAMPGAWVFYIVLGSLEVVLTGLIVGYAWRWPRLVN